MQEALFDVPMYRDFAGLDGMARLPDRVSILRFRHLLEEHRLAEQFLQAVNEQLSAKGYLKVRYRGLFKNTQQITTLFALGKPSSFQMALAKAFFNSCRKAWTMGLARWLLVRNMSSLQPGSGSARSPGRRSRGKAASGSHLCGIRPRPRPA
jgi:hypothetical protein